MVSPRRQWRDVQVSLPLRCIFSRLWRRREEAGPLFAASSGAKDGLMLISLHLSPWAASCLPQLLIHFLFFLRLSSPSPHSPFGVIFSASVFLPSYFPRSGNVVSLPHDKIKGMGTWRKWPFPLFATTLASCIPFSFSFLSILFLLLCVCVYGRLIFTMVSWGRQNDETVQ